MEFIKMHRGTTGLFNKQHLNMVYNQDIYQDFINKPFFLEGFEAQAHEKAAYFTDEKRSILRNALTKQYQDIQLSSGTQANIESLTDRKTFTVTTGHQLSLFTGPLYFVVKILHTIKLCKALEQRYPEYHFVPVYWMATEDHDFEEIQSAHVFNNTITWNSDQKGPVGRFTLEGLNDALDAFKEFFKNHPEGEVMQVLSSLKGKNYADVMRQLVHELFGTAGLVIVDGDDSALKTEMKPLAQKDIQTQFSYKAVSETDRELNDLGAKLQVTPREINLFYIEDGIRERIIKEDNKFIIKGVGVHTEKTLLELLDAHPERFSPNVILRPIYQEMILPNLCYVGGAGEISYWLQLKGVFDAMQVPYPMIQVRNSVLWIDKGVAGKLEKFNFSVDDVFQNEDAWKKAYVQETDQESLDFTDVDTQFDTFSDVLKTTILAADANGEQYANSEIARFKKQLEGIKSKAVKKSKQRHEGAMKAIEMIKAKLFPNNGLQERYVNFFQFCADGDVKPHLNLLYDALDPLNNDLIILVDSKS